VRVDESTLGRKVKVARPVAQQAWRGGVERQASGTRAVFARSVDRRRGIIETMPAWTQPPTALTFLIKQFGTSTAPMHYASNQGEVCVKTMGNPEGPGALACEHLGSALADFLGLTTFEHCAFPYAGPAHPYSGGCRAEPGPAFITRWEAGRVWAGTEEEWA